MSQPSDRYEHAECACLDVSLIRESLSYTYEQRALQHQAALDLVLEIERAWQQWRRDRLNDAALGAEESP